MYAAFTTCGTNVIFRFLLSLKALARIFHQHRMNSSDMLTSSYTSLISLIAHKPEKVRRPVARRSKSPTSYQEHTDFLSCTSDSCSSSIASSPYTLADLPSLCVSPTQLPNHTFTYFPPFLPLPSAPAFTCCPHLLRLRLSLLLCIVRTICISPFYISPSNILGCVI